MKTEDWETGSLTGDRDVAVSCESKGDNTGQEEVGSCKQVEEAQLESTVSHKGEEVKEEELEGNTNRLSPLDSGFVVCKRMRLNWTDVLVGEEEGLEAELSVWISGIPLGLVETLLSVVLSLFVGRAKLGSVLVWMKDVEDDVVLLTLLI